MTPRASGRLAFSARMTSRPLPPPSLRSITAKAGGAASMADSASATVSAVRVKNPRADIPRASRSQNGLSSSTTRSDLSGASTPALPSSFGLSPESSSMRAPVEHEPTRSETYPLLLDPSTLLIGGARPNRGDDRSMGGRRGVGEGQRRARPLQKRPGDEKPQSGAPGAPPGAVRARKIGLADSRQNARRESRAVVGDGDGDGRRRPAGPDENRLFGEADGVFDQGAKSKDHARVAAALCSDRQAHFLQEGGPARVALQILQQPVSFHEAE